MRAIHTIAALAAFIVPVTSLDAQAIIAQSSGLANPQHVIDFGANLFPNFTPVTTQIPGIVVTHARYFTTGTSNNLVGGFLTNDPVGLPNTLSIVFAAPISDLTFVYHQIGTWQSSAFRAVLGGTTVFSFNHLGDQTQPTNYYGFTNLVFDELQIDFVGDFNVDTLAYNHLQATCTTRNGLGINPVDYACVTLPVIGTNWQCVISTNPNTATTFLALAPGGPHPGFPFQSGEVLVQLAPMPVLIESPGSFSITIPNVGSLVGLAAATQGVRVDGVGATQSVVLLNAIDLVLGV